MRKVARLTLDNLATLPGHAAACTFWELDPVRRSRTRGQEAEEKAAWVSTMLREWGPVGRVLEIDGVAAGQIIWAPALHLPGGDGFATAPVSPDAVLLGSTYLAPEFRGQGLGRVLVQAMARDLVTRGGIGAVEAFGSHRRGTCVLPVDFLLAVGFRTHRAHPVHPRMRMDLKTTVSWKEELEAAAERLLGAVTGPVRRPVPGPAPRALSEAAAGLPPG